MYQPCAHYTPEHPDTVEQTQDFIRAVRSVIGDDGKVQYCSGPLTTGAIYNEMVINGADNASARAEAFKYNANVLAQQAIALRAIDPTSFVMSPSGVFYKGWKTDDYMYLWTTVISKIVAEVYLVPSWEYSNGTVGEVHCALVHGIPIFEYEHRVKRLTKDTVIDRISAALSDMSIRGATFPDIADRAAKLKILLDKIKEV